MALFSLTDARRAARTDDLGELVLLEDQDRSLWHAAMIAEGEVLLEAALGQSRPGPFQLYAATAACHPAAVSARDSDWQQIALLYAELIWYEPPQSCRPTGPSPSPWPRARPPGWSSWMPSPIARSSCGGHSCTSPGPNCCAAPGTTTKPGPPTTRRWNWSQPRPPVPSSPGESANSAPAENTGRA
ncbi:MAG: DUF6596 domain-containing protein [Streptosporangiaceae bacterium]